MFIFMHIFSPWQSPSKLGLCSPGLTKMFDFASVTGWVDGFLRSHLSGSWSFFIECVLIGVAILVAYAVVALIMILAERKSLRGIPMPSGA